MLRIYVIEAAVSLLLMILVNEDWMRPTMKIVYFISRLRNIFKLGGEMHYSDKITVTFYGNKYFWF